MIPNDKIAAELAAAKKIIITAHKNPDGDALGSTLGLYHALKQAGKEAWVILPDAFPSFIAWMPGANEVLIFDQQKDLVHELIQDADVLFSLDYNGFDRTGDLAPLLREAKAKKIMVDHHPDPEDGFDIRYSDVSASSTSQMVVELLESLGMLAFITAESATCLYAGIVTDTGSFRFASTRPKTHTIAALLIEKGAENGKIHNQLFDTQTESRLKLLGYALSEKMVVLPQWHAAYFSLSREELKRFNYRKGDTEGLVNYGLGMEGIDMAAIFVEHEDVVKISFRSKGSVPVNALSKANFSGGGHTNAAGGKWDGNLDQALSRFLEVLPDFAEKNILNQ